jgi:hypothetical protein
MSLKALSREDLTALAPSIFNHTVKQGLTDKYVHIPTDQIVEDMEVLGWLPYEVKTVRSRTKNAATKKHLIQFFNKDIVINNNEGKADMYPTIICVNSHDGSTAVRFEMGVFRMVCENGLMIKTLDFGGFKMRHMGYTFEDLRVYINSLVSHLPNVVNSLNKFSLTQMSESQQHEFALKAIESRFGEEKQLSPNEVQNLLLAERKEDQGNDLWKVLNRVQEKLTHGGFSYLSVKGKPRKARAIKNFTQDVEMNLKLWELAESYL